MRAGLIEAVAAHGLTEALPLTVGEVLSRQEWRELVSRCRHERLVPLLAAAVDAGALPSDEAQKAEVDELHTEVMATALRLERLLLAVCDAFAAASIELRVLKGPACAHLAYADPSLREFGDIDILVPGDDFAAAGAELARAGGRRRFVEPRPGFDRRFGKGACFVMPDGFEVDLHRTFVPGPFGMTVDLPSLFESSSPFGVGDRVLPALRREQMLVHACFHAMLGSARPRLVPLRDIAELAAAPTDAATVLEIARRWRAEAVLASALGAARERLSLTPTGEIWSWAASYAPSRRERRQLGVYTGTRRSYAAQMLLAVPAVPARSRASYLLALVAPKMPTPEATASRRWGRGLRAVARR